MVFTPWAELRAHVSGANNSLDFSLERPEVIIRLFIGGLLPFLFSSLSMQAVGKTAGAVVKEVRRQLQAKPGILNGTDDPEYGACVDIVTKAALREMIVPALLPVIFVIVAAFLGPLVLGGYRRDHSHGPFRRHLDDFRRWSLG